MICGHLRKDRDIKTLASLARTAKIFLEPALDALWSHIPGLAPLLRLLPSDLWEIFQVLISDSDKRGPLYVLVCLRAPIYCVPFLNISCRGSVVHPGRKTSFGCVFLLTGSNKLIRNGVTPNLTVHLSVNSHGSAFETLSRARFSLMSPGWRTAR